MKKRYFVGLILVIFVVFAFSSVALAKINIKLAHVVNTQDAFHICAVKFKELVEKGTNGEVSVTIYPNAQLGDERTLLERMKMGVVDAGVITTGPIINFVPKFGVIDLPFLFRGPEHAYKVLDGPIGKSLLKDMEKQGWKGLAFAERGFRNLTNSKRPVYKPADVKGLKIRVMQNPVYVDTFKALGANAVPMAWTEVLTALQQGTVDGQENPLNVIYAFKLYEVQKYLAMTRHAYAPAVVMMSLKTWKRLPEKYRKVIQEAAQKAAEYERSYDNSKESEWLAFIKKKGMVVTYPDIEAFRKAVKPVYDKYAPKFGVKLVEAIINTK